MLRENFRPCDLAWPFRFVSEVPVLETPESFPDRRKRPTFWDTLENDRRKLLVVDEKDGRLEGVAVGGRSCSQVTTGDSDVPVRESAGVSVGPAGAGDALVLSAKGCLATTGRCCDAGM